jgi:hypothetical protein
MRQVAVLLALLAPCQANALIIASAIRSASALIAQSRAALASLLAHPAPASVCASVTLTAHPCIANTSLTLLGQIEGV